FNFGTVKKSSTVFSFSDRSSKLCLEKMENEDTKKLKKGKARLPPKRGQIKAKIFRDTVKILMNALRMGRKREVGRK
ncbi:unnamed protein product, partial [Ilex paraguariensis]